MLTLWISLLLLGLGISSVAEAASEPLAEVDGVAITADEVEKPLASQLSKVEEQIYNLKLQRLEALSNEKLLAKESAKRKLTAPGSGKWGHPFVCAFVTPFATSAPAAS